MSSGQRKRKTSAVGKSRLSQRRRRGTSTTSTMAAVTEPIEVEESGHSSLRTGEEVVDLTCESSLEPVVVDLTHNIDQTLNDSVVIVAERNGKEAYIQQRQLNRRQELSVTALCRGKNGSIHNRQAEHSSRNRRNAGRTNAQATSCILSSDDEDALDNDILASRRSSKLPPTMHTTSRSSGSVTCPICMDGYSERFLRFAVLEDHFQFTALPFGLATAPKGKSFLPIRWLVVTTDASLLGWGAVFLHPSAQGRWTVRESRLPINILEIRAIRLALSRFHTLLAGHPIRVQSDNVTAVAYINHQGGTRSRAAMQEVSHILRWAETNHSTISAVHIPGVENWAADFLSRQGLASGEWELHPEVFRQICLRWGTPDVDLMASRLNAKVHNFIARSRDPQAIGVDALISPWHPFQLPYVFPPLPLLPKAIRKIKSEGVPVILVAPDWPRRAWYAELVRLVADVPWRLPDRPDLLRQGPICHQSSGALRLTAWLLKPGF
ncbi:unnamed protein product [Ranitomeya imitator]|uniref:Reverse transcriptase RNase H-like domain-containing protein n=1 Tax=Ranitomeya imitator TaxID=111125 RepID=A0ABN9LLB5_9NEOB|nr:unnamed protein product [Ranitomeya imitator]